MRLFIYVFIYSVDDLIVFAFVCICSCKKMKRKCRASARGGGYPVARQEGVTDEKGRLGLLKEGLKVQRRVAGLAQAVFLLVPPGHPAGCCLHGLLGNPKGNASKD